MDQYFNSKPSFQAIVDRQKVAHHRLKHQTSQRTPPELANYERTLRPVKLSEVELPKLPLAQLIADPTRQFVILGAAAQDPDRLICCDLKTGFMETNYRCADLEIMLPTA